VTRELTSSKCVGMMGDIMELLLAARLHVQKLSRWVAETGLARFILPRRELSIIVRRFPPAIRLARLVGEG
jgi:hypothetical protein